MGKMEVTSRTLGMLYTNTYFLVNTETKEAIVVDPADSASYIVNQFELRGLKCVAILLTHGHFDHIYGAEPLRNLTGAPIYAYEGEKNLLSDSYLNRSKVWADEVTVKPDKWFKDGEEVTLAGLKFKVLHTPGHSEGSCCYYFEEEKTLIAGDTLFRESFGRTDLSTGDMFQLVNSLKEIIFKLPPETIVFPGHDSFTTIEHELKYNPIAKAY